MNGRGEAYGIETRVAAIAAPETFAERGVVMPFTAPLLTGARFRVNRDDRQELVVGNPATGRGTYVLQWDGVCTLCTPTLYDQLLHEKVRSLRTITPQRVHAAALEVVAEGSAGRAAAAAAAAARAAQQRLLADTTGALLRELVRQVCGIAADDAQLPAQARHAYALVAPKIGLQPEMLPDLVEQLAAAFAPVGVEGTAAAPLPAATEAVAALHDGLRAAFGGLAPTTRPDAWLVMEAARATVACARPTLPNARALLQNLPQLLRGWARSPQAVTAQVERAAWVLDGWLAICALWNDDPKLDSPLLGEMAAAVPSLPREAAEWGLGLADGGVVSLPERARVLEPDHDGDRSATLETIARNERLLARMLMAA